MRFALKRGPERLAIEIDGRSVQVAVARNSRARRLILKIDGVSGLPIITLPPRTSLAQGDRFLHANAAWLRSRLRRVAPPVPFCDGAAFPLRGARCRIRHRGGRGRVALECEGDDLLLSVPGEAEFLARRVLGWLKREARRDLERAVARYAEALGRTPAGIRVDDAKSRWGSCSARGVLTFSWRLVLAPPRVLDYLAAHEAAHLVEMNHGPGFRAMLDQLYPGHAGARAWLKASGPTLHAVGRPVELLP